MKKEKKRQRKIKNRIDYRTGGRVGYQEGEKVTKALTPEGVLPATAMETSTQPAPQPLEMQPVQQEQLPPSQAPQDYSQSQQSIEADQKQASESRDPAPELKYGGKGLGGMLTRAKNQAALDAYYQKNPTNPLAGQSDVAKRIAGGERITQMNFYWVQPDGTIGSTNEGYSRVPSQFRNQVYLSQGAANDASFSYNTWVKGDTTDTGDSGGQDTDNDAKDRFETERGERIIRTGQTAEQIASGDIPEGMVPQAKLIEVKTGNEYIDQAVQLGELTPIEAEKIKNITPEQVSAMEAAQAERPAVIEAAKIQVSKLQESPEVQAAQGEVRDESLARAANVERVDAIEGAEVNIPEGALTDRVVGTISEAAKAVAVKNVGTSLARITRAKDQLAKAGLTQDQINEIGNDPEALEARLADFSDEQRGLIQGLPKEALVSNQMDSLLQGLEDGNIPPWASPAVSQVEQMLASRGLSASTVGRTSLFNAIIAAAMPLAQSNAQAIQTSVSQQRGIEASINEANAQRAQQVGLTNSSNVFQLNMAQFSADQQTALSNSKFMQTIGLSEANFDQQSTVQNAVLLSQANLAEADFNQKAQIQNATAFLQTDLTNLSNEQQANIIRAQNEQQRLLSNNAAENAARQFNASSENQTQQFMSGLNSQINQFNTAQANASAQFNAQQKNAAEARRVGLEADINKANAAIMNQVTQFNAQLEYNREQWNATNQQAIQQSNVKWRRKANLADTAAANAINQQNVSNAFGLTSAAQSFLWQELRDQASFDFQFADNTASRKNNAMIAAASAEGDAAKNWSSNYNNVASIVDKIFTGD